VRKTDDRLAGTTQIHLMLLFTIGLVLQQFDFLVGSAEDILVCDARCLFSLFLSIRFVFCGSFMLCLFVC
jgi:hypothetical protein